MSNIKEDFTGHRFGILTVVGDGEPFFEGRIKQKRRRVICKCDCGNEKLILLRSLKRGNTVSCGLCRENLVGRVNGHLELIEEIKGSKYKRRLFKVKCHNCGSEDKVYNTTKFKERTHCGCIPSPPREKKPLNLPIIKGILTIIEEVELGKKVKVRCNLCSHEYEKVYPLHSVPKTGCVKCWNNKKEYTLEEQKQRRDKKSIATVYSNIKSRIRNPNCKDYVNYGGRGIKMTEEWNTFKEFYQWSITNGYEQGLSIDRIDNNGDYTPENCRWVPRTIQNRNQRTTKLTEDIVKNIRYGDDKDKTDNFLAELYGCSMGAISSVRLFKSWKEI